MTDQRLTQSGADAGAEHEALLASLLSHGPFLCCQMGADYRILQASPALCTWLERDVEGQTLLDLMSEEDRAEQIAQFDTRLTASAGPIEIDLASGTGENLTAIFSSMPLPGEGAGNLAILLDVTQSKRELREAKAGERESNEAKSQFLASMSHELRTPLNIVQGYSELLLDMAPDPLQTEYLDIIISSTKKLSQMLEDVLDLSKIEAGQMHIDHEAFDLAGLFEEVRQDWIQPCRNKGLRFFANFDDRLRPLGRSDRVRLKQVLTNFLSNAFKFTESGTILLSAELIDETETGQFVRFSVEDSGPGVPDAYESRLFQAFQKGDKRDGKGRGWGLGLSIVQRIAEMLDAKVGYRAVQRGGSLFFFEVMIRFEDAKQDATQPPRWDLGSDVLSLPRDRRTLYTNRNLKCLIVEDNRENAMLLGAILERLGCTAVYAVDGEEGIERAREQEFDIIFMDIRMPKLDGVAASRQIRGNEGPNRNAPIVAVTANSNRTSTVDYRLAGMQSCITKPYTSTDIVRSIRALAR